MSSTVLEQQVSRGSVITFSTGVTGAGERGHADHWIVRGQPLRGSGSCSSVDRGCCS